MKAIIFSLSLLYLFVPVLSQDTISINKRADFGIILSIMGNKPIDLTSYNKDFNLIQTYLAPQSAIFYRIYLGRMFDIQIEATTGTRFLDIQDTTFNFRLTDVYYSLNLLPVLKIGDDDIISQKVQFNMMVGPSVNFLGSRKFSYPQNIYPRYPNLSFGEVITLALYGDMGIKYNFSTYNSFLMGLRGSTDYFLINDSPIDELKVKYWNYGLYIGFAGKLRKR